MISLTLCMIVKNEEAVLERILNPVSEIVDEILIADTGSSDRTKEIAGQYTSQVFDFPWCDDFSAARNFLVEKVRTDYWMWLQDLLHAADSDHKGQSVLHSDYPDIPEYDEPVQSFHIL